jgi:hypothetical protein
MEIYNQDIKTLLENHFLAAENAEQDNRKAKDSFWASQTEAPLFDLYHQWIGTPPTNPIEAEKLVMFSAAKLMEVALINKLTEMGLCKKLEDQQRIEIVRHGVKITGYVDGVFTDGTPLECKTMYGDYQAKELKDGKPKTSYLKQLAIYMDALNVNQGKLIYMHRGTGEMYEFTLSREPGTLIFRCLEITFDLNDTYKRWADLYNGYIVPGKEPDLYENGTYKADLDKIDWKKVSRADIAKARAGTKVIGTDRENGWKILYSPYKDLLIEKQGAKLGYDEKELEQIKLATKGYSSKS